MPDTAANDEFAFGTCRVRFATRELLVNGKPAKVGSRAFDLLQTLIAHRERVVSKKELLAAVWPDTVVEVNNLQVQVSTLRRLLGAGAIATVPGHGYRLAAAGHNGGGAPHAAAIAAAAIGHELAPLIGRETELQALRACLQAHRLSTVVGPGGIGKTRLAQAAAQAELARFADDVCWIELAPATQADEVLGAAARALGLTLAQRADAEALASRCADRQALLVLDNCEHQIDAAAELVTALLRSAPQLTVLATSQQPLRLPDEHLFRLGPLAVPRDGSDGANAVSLFAARAQAVSPSFELTDANRREVAEICLHLDGNPLAIGLAAARVPLLGVTGVLERLDGRLALLTGGMRDAPARQRTLRDALEWSHALLDDDERRAFRRLGVFVGSFGLEAAQEVASADDDGAADWQTLDALGALVDKSLVMVDGTHPPRYRLYESGRVFALEELQRHGEHAACAGRLTQHLLARFASVASLGRADPVQVATARAALLPDIDNLRACLRWAAGQRADTLLIELTGVSWWLWPRALAPAEGLARCNEALALCTPATPAVHEARLLYGYAVLSHELAASRELTALKRAAALFSAQGDAVGAYKALTLLAQKLVWHDEVQAAERAVADAEALWDDAWAPLMRASLLLARARCLEAAGRSAEGQPLMEELVALARTAGDARKVDHALMHLADNLFTQGKAKASVEVRREVLRHIGRRRVDYVGSAMAQLSAALTHLGAYDEAREQAQGALPMLAREGRLAPFLDHVALLACRREQFDAAARALGRADAHYAHTGFDRAPSDLRAANRVRSLLSRALPGERLRALTAEGAALGDSAAARQALTT